MIGHQRLYLGFTVATPNRHGSARQLRDHKSMIETIVINPDSHDRYGSISRALHWGIALCFGWMFSSALTHLLAEKSALDALLWPTHKHLGSALMVLVLLRGAWALANARRRPPAINRLAHAGHLALHTLMVAIPLIGLLRQYGSGRAFSPLGLPLFPGFDASQKIDGLVELGNNWHGELGWTLLALVCGHVAMALWHRGHAQHDVLPRMIGRPAPAR